MGVFGRVWCICWGTSVFPGVPVYLVGYGSSLSGMGVNDGVWVYLLGYTKSVVHFAN